MQRFYVWANQDQLVHKFHSHWYQSAHLTTGKKVNKQHSFNAIFPQPIKSVFASVQININDSCLEYLWEFIAVQVKTQQVDHFKEVTYGVDTLYSIPSTSLQHQGTYQCEIYSGQRSIVRLYYYLTGNKMHHF